MHLCTLQQHAFTNALHERVIWNQPRTNVCQTASKTQLKQLLARCANWTTKKCYYIHCTTKNTQSFHFAWNFVCTKKQGKILLARGLSIQQLSALGRWKVTILLLLYLWKKCEYHRTCCDYLVAAACQDGSAWNERMKIPTFSSAGPKYVFEICDKAMHARSGAWRCCVGKGRRARLQCELLLAATFIICWTLNLHWFVLLGSSKKFTSRDHWITALSQINGCYSSRCLSCPRNALR